jgi:hypothetical protein
MEQPDLFSDPRRTVSDEEVVSVLRAAITRDGGLPRSADLLLSGLCAEHLLDRIHSAGLEVVRRPVAKMRE